MARSLFADLCDIADGFERYVRDLPSGSDRDHLEDLVRRLDQLIDRTVGVEDVNTSREA